MIKVMPSRPLYIQLIFTILAFAAMVFLSYLFMRDIVHDNLARNAQSVFNFAENQLEAELLEPRIMLSGYSQTIRSMLLRGDNLEDVKGYTRDIAEYIHSMGSRVLSSINIYGYFEAFGKPEFVGHNGLPATFIPFERPWFILATENCGETIETPPYWSELTENVVIAFARCIHDEADNRLAIVCLTVNIEDVCESIVNIALDQGGYGMVLSQDLTIIAHLNENFIGKNLYDGDMPLSIYADDIARGVDISERPLISWTNEETVVFIRRLNNGWYLVLLTPEGPFYESLSNMASTIITLGVVFTVILTMILIRIDAARTKSDKESRHKSAFLANMSHEIRTPMNAIIGMTTIGKSTSNVERKDHCLKKIEDASNHLLGVINDILDMSKIEANKFDLSPVEFNFEKMLVRIVNVVNFRVDEKNQKLSVHIDSKIPKNLIGDDQRLAQVITNLLSNAIKFTPENGKINLDTRFVDEESGLCTIEFSVTDNGIGMNYEQQKRIFTSFEQAESSTTRKYGCTGLGLPISKSIVELMGGVIWIDSEVGKGSTFSFIVKMLRGVSCHYGLLSPDVNLDNARILVVDDDSGILEYFMEITKEFGVNCDTAVSGEEALRLVEKKGSYHIYFIDWKMPEMDGIQLTSKLKERHGSSAKSVVIMITAAEWTSVENEARSAGVDKFLSKPLFPSGIANAINESLGIDYTKVDEALNENNIDGIYKGWSILIAEDVEINREIVMTLLEPTGIEIDFAENGKEALRKFSESPEKYDLIFMDIQMPEMDGYETTRRIRALNTPQSKLVRIIAMTANVFREDIERCFEVGMDNHISKPIDFNEILEKLNLYLPKEI